MCLLEKVFGLNHIVMQSQVVHLKKRCLNLHLWQAKLVDLLDHLLDLCLRVFHEVDGLELGSSLVATFLLNSLLDLLISLVVLVVTILEFDQSNSCLEHIQIELLKHLCGLVNQEQKLVLVVNSLEIVDAARAGG